MASIIGKTTKRSFTHSACALGAVSLLAVSMLTIETRDANAGSGDFVGGLIVGGAAGVIGTCLATKSCGKKKKRATRTKRRTYKAAPQWSDSHQLQKDLQLTGYYSGPINGNIGPMTQSAVAAYQQSYGLPATGLLLADERSILSQQAKMSQWRGHLLNSTAYQGRARNKRIQSGLQIFGLYAGKLDGAIGPQSRNAIAQYKASRGMAVSGVLTPLELDTMVSEAMQELQNREQNYRTTLASIGQSRGGYVVPNNQGVITAYQQQTLQQPIIVAPSNVAVEAPQYIAPPAPQVQLSAAPSIADTAVTDTKPAQALSFLDSAPLENEPNDQFAAKPLYASRDEQPKVLGLTVGEDFDSALGILEEAGYKSCEVAGSSLTCRSSNDTTVDAIYIAGVENDGNTVIHSVHRHLKFAKPLGRKTLKQQLSGSYERLIEAEGNALMSADNCSSSLANEKGINVSTLIEQTKQSNLLNEDVRTAVESCGEYYSIDFEGGEKVKELKITLYNGAPILAAFEQSDIAEVPLKF